MTSEATLDHRSEAIPAAMHIGEVAARTELSLRSLRHWDEVGLLRPSGRTDGGFRLYTEADVEKILVIRRMKPLGFTLDQMSAAMRDIEALHLHGRDAAARRPARERLARDPRRGSRAARRSWNSSSRWLTSSCELLSSRLA